MPEKDPRGGEGGVLDIMRGRSYDHRPSHPYSAATEHVGFFTDQAGIACCLHQARSAVRCSASRMKRELHPTTGRTASEAVLHMDGNFNGFIYFLVWLGSYSFDGGSAFFRYFFLNDGVP